MVSAKRTAGDLGPGASTGAFASIGMTDLVVAAVAGDKLVFGASFRANAGPQTYVDVATVVAGAPVNWLGADGGAGSFGIASYLVETGVDSPRGGDVAYTVVAGDVVGGTVTLRMYYRTATGVGPVFNATTALPFQIFVLNFGQ